MPNSNLLEDGSVADERGDVSSAPESGALAGAREDPWKDDDDVTPAHDWPSSHHAAPKDEL
jgi:hypothetical protein